MFMSLASGVDMAENSLNTCFRFAVVLLLFYTPGNKDPRG